MPTLEDAAQELVVRLKGLDSEIEESGGQMDDLRARVQAATREVEQEWTALSEAASSFLQKTGEEQERLRDQARETAQAVVDAQNAVAADGAEARQDVAEGRAQMEALGQHAAGLEPAVESLASEAGEAPARTLAERARELEQELNQLTEEARDFLQDDVVAAANDAADELRQLCETVQGSLTQAAAEAFQQTYEEWESTVGELEDYVATQGYEASHQHAHAVVEYAIGECDTACSQQLDELRQLVGLLLSQLQEMAGEVQRSADGVVAQAGAELLAELERTRAAATTAVAALDHVKTELAAYSFVEV